MSNYKNNINCTLQSTQHGVFLDVHFNKSRLTRINVSAYSQRQREQLQSGILKLAFNLEEELVKW
ncbi:MAG: hypothetical protein GY774_04810 [Planctomycetes bacterium]|nr:hypothetical protein [Planctomycetota bacterium]